MNYCEEQALCGSYCVRWDQCFWCQRYQSGQAKPNYPMPAIRLTVFEDIVGYIIGNPYPPIVIETQKLDNWTF